MKIATLCYVRDGDKILMVHKQKGDEHDGKWNGLGGKMDPGESPEDCVIREVKEESGLTIKDPVMKGVLTFPNFFGHDWYVFVFIATEFEGELMEDSPEGELEWIPTGDLLDLNLWPGDRHFLPLLDEPGFFSIKDVYDDGTLVNHIEHRYE